MLLITPAVSDSTVKTQAMKGTVGNRVQIAPSKRAVIVIAAENVNTPQPNETESPARARAAGVDCGRG